MKNALKSINLEFHIIQSFPVSCLNRDKLNSPKTAIVGGVERARVSSQSWKRSIRANMRNFDVQLGVRTGKIDTLLTEKIQSLGADKDVAEICASNISSYIAKDTLVFISDKELNALASYAESRSFSLGAISSTEDGAKKKDKKEKKEAKVDDEKAIAKLLKDVTGSGLDAVDIALFGRMIAKISDINIDAALSVSHAISTHGVAQDHDFFTANDDLGGNGSASYLGETAFNSATYYRYLNLNLGQLAETIFGDSAVDVDQLKKILEGFIKALYVAVPIARQSTQSAYTPWDYAQVLVRKGQPLQMNFDEPVKATRFSGYSEPSIEKLRTQISNREKLSGSLFGLVKKMEFGRDLDYSLDNLITDVTDALEVVHG